MSEETYNIYNLLDKMRERPALYLGKKSLICLDAYAEGYRWALLDRGIKDVSEPAFFSIEFHDWVAAKLGYNYSQMGWCNAILSAALGGSPKSKKPWERLQVRAVKPVEDAAAFDRFYELLDEWRHSGHKERDAVKAKMLQYQDDY